jgi:cell division protein FtsI/penicillin-binding protein 2
VVNAAEVADTAHKIFGIDANRALRATAEQASSQFVYVDRFADPTKAKLFLAKHFTGVDSYPEQKRVYPQLTVAPQVIGYAGLDRPRARAGSSSSTTSSFRGRPGKQTVITDPLGGAIDVISSRSAQQGATSSRRSTTRSRRRPSRCCGRPWREWKAKAASAIVLDPTTGDARDGAGAGLQRQRLEHRLGGRLQRNRSVTDTYEPGSTFKLVTITAALSEGIVKPTTKFTLPYKLRYGPCEQCTVHDADIRPTETLSVAQILAQSSNVGAVTIAEKLGPTMLSKWIAKFGFGQTTGIDFPGESPGFVLPLNQWSETTIGNNPIGQGISVTPIQMASVYAAVANGGVWIQPHLVSRVGGRAPQTWKHRRIMSPAVDAQVKTMLTGVVADVGATGTAAAIPGYTVAGKTGTAQVSSDGKSGIRNTTSWPRSSEWFRRPIRSSSCSSRSTTRADRSSVVRLQRRLSRRSRSSISSTSRSRLTSRVRRSAPARRPARSSKTDPRLGPAATRSFHRVLTPRAPRGACASLETTLSRIM